MTGTTDTTAAPYSTDEIVAGLERYWTAIRGARRLPIRTDVDPAQIDSALPYAFILERVAPGVARFRVAGQRVTEVLGMDVRGMPMSCMFDIVARPILASCLERCFALPAVVGADLKINIGRLRRPVVARLLLLPLQGADGEVNRALGAIVSEPEGRRISGGQIDFVDPGTIRCDPVYQVITQSRPAAPVLRGINPTPGRPVVTVVRNAAKRPAVARPTLYLAVSND